jgi:replicative DNA helicase
MAENILDPLEVIDYASDLLNPQPAMSTGLPGWDEACAQTGGKGLAAGWYVVIGGASNAGKTRFALNLYQRAALQSWKPGLITMEVPKRGIQRQVYSQITSFGYYEFLPDAWLTGDAAAKTEKLAKEVRTYAEADMPKRKMHVCEFERAPTLDNILDACEALRDAGCKVIFLDHMQLIKASAHELADRATEISEELRWFAHGSGILTIALSQLNRMASRERDRRPMMQDLYGGTSVESNANQVVLVDHSRQDRDLGAKHQMRTWVILDKNREGPNRIDIPVLADFRSGLWDEADYEELGRWPGNEEGS